MSLSKKLKSNRHLLDSLFFDKNNHQWYKNLKYTNGCLIRKELKSLENENVIAWQTYQNMMFQPEDE